MRRKYVLGIETTCDETSFAIIEDGKKVIKMVTNSQMEFFKDFGGVVPELASRNHIKNIMYVYDELFRNIDLSIKDIERISVASDPGLKGSILVGLTFAKTLSQIHNIELVEVNHLHAHLMSAIFNNTYEFPILALSVSGGHSNIIKFDSLNDYEIIGHTLDDSLGEAFDKISMMLGLGYPGGPKIEKLAKEGKETLKMPNVTTSRYEFSYSGFKTYINQKYIIPGGYEKEDICASFQNGAFKHIIKKYDNAIKDFNPKQLLVVGGVSANDKFRTMLYETAKKNRKNIIFPKMEYSTDNGAMVGSLGYFYEKS